MSWKDCGFGSVWIKTMSMLHTTVKWRQVDWNVYWIVEVLNISQTVELVKPLYLGGTIYQNIQYENKTYDL